MAGRWPFFVPGFFAVGIGTALWARGKTIHRIVGEGIAALSAATLIPRFLARLSPSGRFRIARLALDPPSGQRGLYGDQLLRPGRSHGSWLVEACELCWRGCGNGWRSAGGGGPCGEGGAR